MTARTLHQYAGLPAIPPAPKAQKQYDDEARSAMRRELRRFLLLQQHRRMSWRV